MAIQTQLYPPPPTPPSNAAAGPLCGSQDFMIDHNHSSFSFQYNYNHQHQQQLVSTLQHQHQHQINNPNITIFEPALRFNSNAYNINHSSTPNSQRNLALLFQNQRDQVDQFIKSQNERLRMMLQEQRKQQATTLLKRVESDALHLLNQKDKEIEQAMREMAELEAFVTRLEAENQSWQRAAQEKEAMIMSLNKSLEHMKERAKFFNNNGVGVMEDAESCNDQNKGMRMEETGENRVCSGEADEQSTKKMNVVCNNCNSGRSCIMFLPCRHLSSCKACEPLLQACPICTMPKKNTIEIRDFDLIF